MVLTLMIPARKIYGLQDLITPKHIDNMAKIILLDRNDRGIRLQHGVLHGLLRCQQV
jgi:hypothetical protein